MSDPAKTPPAWISSVRDRLMRVEDELKKLKSVQGADRLALGHQIGMLSEQVREMFDYIREKLP